MPTNHALHHTHTRRILHLERPTIEETRLTKLPTYRDGLGFGSLGCLRALVSL